METVGRLAQGGSLFLLTWPGLTASPLSASIETTTPPTSACNPMIEMLKGEANQAQLGSLYIYNKSSFCSTQKIPSLTNRSEIRSMLAADHMNTAEKGSEQKEA